MARAVSAAPASPARARNDRTRSRSPVESRRSAKTEARTTKAAGTGRPRRVIVAKPAHLPPASFESSQSGSPNCRIGGRDTGSVLDDGDRPDRRRGGVHTLDWEDRQLEAMTASDLLQIHQVFEVPVGCLVHDAVRLPELLALEHGPDGRVEGDGVDAHEPHAFRDQVQRRLARHPGVVGAISLLGVVCPRARVDEDDVALLESDTGFLDRFIDVRGGNPITLWLVGEVEHHAIRVAELERDRLWTARAGDEVANRAEGGADVVPA